MHSLSLNDNDITSRGISHVRQIVDSVRSQTLRILEISGCFEVFENHLRCWNFLERFIVLPSASLSTTNVVSGPAQHLPWCESWLTATKHFKSLFHTEIVVLFEDLDEVRRFVPSINDDNNPLAYIGHRQSELSMYVEQ